MVLARKDPCVAPEAGSAWEDSACMRRYIAKCERQYAASVLPRLEGLAEPCFLFGAGSHTARLLGRHGRLFARCCTGILENNPNLHGAVMGGFNILSPRAVDPAAVNCVVVSSYKAGKAMAAEVAQRFPHAQVITLYT